MIDFRTIRERISAQDAAEFYGAEFDRRGWVLCPFHGDTHPSISFKNGRFRCWSCGASGDALDYTARLFNLDSVQAANKLNIDFNLGLSDAQSDDAETQRKIEERRATAAAHRRFEEWRAQTISRLNEVCRMAHTALKCLPEPLSEWECLAVRYQARAEYLSDKLEDGTPEEQAQLFREREEAERWICQILNVSQS